MKTPSSAAACKEKIQSEAFDEVMHVFCAYRLVLSEEDEPSRGRCWHCPFRAEVAKST